MTPRTKVIKQPNEEDWVQRGTSDNPKLRDSVLQQQWVGRAAAHDILDVSLKGIMQIGQDAERGGCNS